MDRLKRSPLPVAVVVSYFVRLLLALVCVAHFGCDSSNLKTERDPESQPPKPSEVSLGTVKLTRSAEKRLGIQTAPIRYGKVQDVRSLGGEVLVPPGHALKVTAPVAGTLVAANSTLPSAGAMVSRGQALFSLLPLERDLRGRDLAAQAEQDLSVAQAEAMEAKARAQRAEQLLKDGAASERAVEEAHGRLARAEATLKGAQAQVAYLEATPLEAGAGVTISSPVDGALLRLDTSAGQSVAAGAPLFEVADLDPVWIRVPVYVGDLSSITTGEPAIVHELGGSPESGRRRARPVKAPPTADAATATADLYFELSNPGYSLRPGQKVGVTLQLRGETKGLVVPWSAVIHDIHGGTWVYECPEPQTFARRRVEVRFVSGDSAVLSRGPAAGTPVVTVGAAELFGTEFGTGK